jgi:hypothetical protein
VPRPREFGQRKDGSVDQKALAAQLFQTYVGRPLGEYRFRIHLGTSLRACGCAEHQDVFDSGIKLRTTTM